jgi:hypothetical protein
LVEREIAVRVLAEHLSKTVKPKSVLLVSNPFAQLPNQKRYVYIFQSAAESGAKKGFSADTKIDVVFPKLRPEATDKNSNLYVDPRTRTPLSFLVAENSFDEVIRAHPGCDLVLSVIGMPLDTAGLPSWNRAGAPKFALLLPDFNLMGGPQPIRRAFQSGKLAAAVVMRPGAPPPSDAIYGDYQTEFQRRFILVTAENFEENLKYLFKK